MSDINQLKHFDALDYKGEYFTNELKDGEECRCLKGVKLEDVTPELEQKAFEEMK